MDSLFLAFQFIKFHKVRSTVLVVSISIIIFLPNGLQKLVKESERIMLDRANSTPLIIGTKGSATDLVINSLYFQQEKIENITFSKVNELNQTNLGRSIPILCAFNARDYPIVGTDLDYFNFRDIELSSGRWMSVVGECVIGSNIAKNLGLTLGDSLISSSESFFDFAGIYPLKMEITGILNPSDSPDDNAIFVDVKTTWIIMGLGHGHQDLETISDPTIVLDRNDSVVTAGAKLFLYNEITKKNRDSFHFHGDMSDYPITSVIFIPNDSKSQTILRGRFETGEIADQVIVPNDIVNNLLGSIFRIQQIFDSVFIAVGVSTLMILGLIVALGVRLRQNEIKTMFTIGSSRTKIIEIISLELLIIIALSGLLATVLYFFTDLYVEDFLYRFII